MAKKKMTLEEKLEEAIVKVAHYEVPENWVWVKLGDYIDYATDYVANGSFASLKENVRTYKEENYALMIRTKDFSNNFEKDLTYTDKKGYEFLDKSCLFGGELILSNIGASIGKVFKVPYLNRPMTLAPNSIMLKCNEKSKNYLYYLFLSPIGNNLLKSISSGTATPKFNKTGLKDVVIPIPPLEEQQRIVDKIENLFEKLYKAKELIEEARDDFEKRKSAILEKAFRGELTKEWRDNNGIINEYKKYILKDLLKPMTNKKPDLSQVNFRYIDIDAIDNKKQVVGEPKIIETIKAPSRASREVVKGDVVFSTVRPYLRNIAYITEDLEDCIASTGFYICRCKEMLDSRFLYRMLCSDSVLNYYTSLMKGDNSPSIRKGEFEGLSINLPSLEEQKEIVRIIDKFFEQEAKIEELTQLEEQIELIKKSILAKAFRGQLGTNCKEDESALELLKNILNA